MDKLLQDEAFKDFLKTIQFNKLRDILRAYAQNDAKMKGLIQYMKSNTYEKNTEGLDNCAEYKAIMDHFDKNGIPLYQYIIALRCYLLELKVEKLKPAQHKPTGSGFSALIADLKAVLPKEEIAKIAKEKSTSSDRFKKIMTALKADEYKTLKENLKKAPAFQKYCVDMKAQGVDIAVVAAFARSMVGLE